MRIPIEWFKFKLEYVYVTFVDSNGNLGSRYSPCLRKLQFRINHLPELG